MRKGTIAILMASFLLGVSYMMGAIHNPFTEAFESSFCRYTDKRGSKRVGWFAPHIVREALELNANFIFSANSFKIATSFFPFYVAARMIDEKIHSCFYDPCRHKNCSQLPWWCHDIAQIGIGIPIVVISSLAIFGKTDEIRTTGRVFLVGIPFVIYGKEIIKKWDGDHCLRPKNEHFCRWKKYYGGFPSGHIAEATYTAVLAGMRFGAKAAVPLSLFALFVGGTFINCNRHYTSQVVAGAAFGAMYALAANSVIKHELSEKFRLSLDCDHHGIPGVSIGYRF